MYNLIFHIIQVEYYIRKQQKYLHRYHDNIVKKLTHEIKDKSLGFELNLSIISNKLFTKCQRFPL